MSQKNIHLVCSSGGIRCLSYIGAIRRLLASENTIASISACSMGSVIGALICSGMDLDSIENKLRAFKFSSLKKNKTFYPLNAYRYPFSRNRTPDFEKLMVDLLGEDLRLGDMKIPFSVAAMDLRQQRFLVYSSETHPEMKISETVRIATAIPLLYDPFEFDKRLLIDAALLTESPVWMATGQPGNYPILVLKTISTPRVVEKLWLPNFIGELFNTSSRCHDHFMISQTSRAIAIDINCGDLAYDDFDISESQINMLLAQGEKAADLKLNEYKNDFGHILRLEEIKDVSKTANHVDKAAFNAKRLIRGFQNELINRNQIFVSYSHNDKEWLGRLQPYLNSLETYLGIQSWDDTEIEPGDYWRQEIDSAMASTKVAVFLVTQDFLASNFIREEEMSYFLKISRQEKVKIVWVAVSSSLYDKTPLKDIQCANNPNRPLDQLSKAEQNKELVEISNKIIELMN